MIFLTNSENTTNKTADEFASALAETPAELMQLAMSDVVLVDESKPSEQPLTLPALAPVAPAAPPAVTAQPDAVPIPPTPEATPPVSEAVPPTTNDPVLRQVQEATSLLAASTPDEAAEFLAKIAEINKPLAENLTALLKSHLEESGQQFTSIPVELPTTQFDFENRSEQDYDEQTWADLQAAKQDIDALTQAATYWQQQALAAQSAVPASSQPSLKDQFLTQRAQAIDHALATVPTFQGNEVARNIVREATLSRLRVLPEFTDGLQSATSGNAIKAHNNGLLIDNAIGQFIAEAANQFNPAPTSAPNNPPPAIPATPAAMPAVPSGAPAIQAAIPPAPLPASGSLMDAVLAEINHLEQSGAANWGA